MATLSSLQDRLQGLGSRLQAENEAHSKDRMNANPTLDFSRERAGSERRPRPPPFAEFQLPGRPNTISARPRGERPRIEPLLFLKPKQHQDSPELSAHVKEISRKKGLITVNGKQYKSTIDDMKYISELGNGTSGIVVKMLHKPSQQYIAVKQMHRSGNLEEAKRVFFDLEVVLKSHDCPYIVQCLGCFVTDTDVWICMELMSTCLDKLMKRHKQPLPETIIGKISVATVKALHYLKESHGVIHRDVKPSNILLDECGNIKLCDFGISGRLVDSKANSRSAGCAAYMAPERIDPPDPKKPVYDIRADVWSLGITLVELATGQFPYKDCKTDFEMLTKVLQDEPPILPPDKKFSIEFREFVNDCLIKDYKQRPKYKRLLEYPFIRKYEKERVDVTKWYSGVSRAIEEDLKTWSQNLFSPLFPRNTNSRRVPLSAPTPETNPIPPPVAPRRRSRTPDTRSYDLYSQSLKEDRNNVAHSSHMKVSAIAAYGRSIPESTNASRALSASPVPRTQFFDTHSSAHSIVSHSGSTLPQHQYGVPSQFSLNRTPKPYSQMYGQYPNPYSQSQIRALPIPYEPNHLNSGHLSTSVGDSKQSNSRSFLSRFSMNNSNSCSGPQVGTSPSYTVASSSLSSSSSSGSQTPQILRKTPEPIRFNPEPWAPRGRFAQTTNHHFRSLSYDLTGQSNTSRSPLSYFPPHVSPLVSRRTLGINAQPEKSPRQASLNLTGPSSLPSTVASPHYRYIQEVHSNSKPYYTPEPQRRTFPRISNT